MLERTALNAVINEGLDFACSFTTADGRVVAQGQRDLLAFIGTALVWVKNRSTGSGSSGSARETW